MGILDRNPVPIIEDPHVMIDEAYLVQGHILKRGPDDSLIFFSLGYANEIPLPNAGYHLYHYQSLTTPLIPEEAACRHSVSGLSGRFTRNRTRREIAAQPQPPHHINMRWDVHPGKAQGWMNGHSKPRSTTPAPAPAVLRIFHDARPRLEIMVT